MFVKIFSWVQIVFSWIVTFFKTNLAFGLGMIIGSLIGTFTTVFLTMGYLGGTETLQMYQQAVCGG